MGLRVRSDQANDFVNSVFGFLPKMLSFLSFFVWVLRATGHNWRTVPDWRLSPISFTTFPSLSGTLERLCGLYRPVIRDEHWCLVLDMSCHPRFRDYKSIPCPGCASLALRRTRQVAVRWTLSFVVLTMRGKWKCLLQCHNLSTENCGQETCSWHGLEESVKGSLLPGK